MRATSRRSCTSRCHRRRCRAMGVGEQRLGHPELGGLGVHGRHEGLVGGLRIVGLHPLAQRLGDGDGSVVARGDHESRERRLKGERVARPQTRRRLAHLRGLLLTVTVLSRGTPESSATMAVIILVMEAMCDRSRAPREKSTVPSSSMTSAKDAVTFGQTTAGSPRASTEAPRISSVRARRRRPVPARPKAAQAAEPKRSRAPALTDGRLLVRTAVFDGA